MGIAASSGCDNDDLVDKLVADNFVVNRQIETVLRIVDRRHFFPKEGRMYAYRNLAWRSETESPEFIHISSPRVYAKVLECLDLMEGNKFLNIGSGTGYLNTLAGYFLGSTGANHGIEIHPNIVLYARELVEETLKRPETQCFEWAVPEFTCGNGLFLSPDHYGKYDRVYCGAAVPPSHRWALWQLIKIGGIIVMPYEDQMQQVRRKTENVFEVNIFSSVTFLSFILPTEEETSKGLYASAPPLIAVPKLQYICAIFIRRFVRTVLLITRKIHIRNYASQQLWRVHGNRDARCGSKSILPEYHGYHSPFRETYTVLGPNLILKGTVNERISVIEQWEQLMDQMRWFHEEMEAFAIELKRFLQQLLMQVNEEEDSRDHNNGHRISNDSLKTSGSESADSIGTSQDAVGTSGDGPSRASFSKKRSHFGSKGESSGGKRRNNDGTGKRNNEFEKDKKISSERGRLREAEWQRQDMKQFALLFERRLMELPLSEALKNYLKYLPK